MPVFGQPPGVGLERLKLGISDQFKAPRCPIWSKTRSFHAIEPARVRGRPNTPPRVSAGLIAAAGRQAHRHQRIHTSFSASTFRARPARNVCRLSTLSCASVVSRRRFTLYSAVSPSLPLKCWLPTSPGQEVPELDMNYCDPHRHFPQYHPSFHKTEPCFHSRQLVLSLSPHRCSQSTSGIRVGPHRVRTTAQRLWLWGSLHAGSCPATRALSYPDASVFSECNAFQLSPRAPAASLRSHLH